MKNFKISGLLLITLFLQNLVFAQNSPKQDLLTFEQFEAKLTAAGKDAQILDARLPEEFTQNHLENAVNFNITSKEELEKQSARLDKNKPVFIYSIGSGRSSILAKDLKDNGFKDVTVVPGGLSKWIGLGKPVISTVGKGLSKEDYLASLKSDKLVLVDFGSRYCPGCKKLDPTIDSLKNEQVGSLKVIKIEAYENKDLVKQLGVVGLPTLILYRNNEVVWEKKGGASKAEIEKVLAGQTL